MSIKLMGKIGINQSKMNNINFTKSQIETSMYILKYTLEKIERNDFENVQKNLNVVKKTLHHVIENYMEDFEKNSSSLFTKKILSQQDQKKFDRKVELMLSDPRFFGDKDQAIENVKFMQEMEEKN